MGGGGVDGVIHQAAGPELLAECRTLGGARPGQVKLTGAYRLAAKFIAHAVGPVWRGGGKGEAALLASCYRQALELTEEKELESLAFPAISTGAYRYPILPATRIAVQAVREHLLARALPGRVIFCCFSQADMQVYERVAAELLER